MLREISVQVKYEWIPRSEDGGNTNPVRGSNSTKTLRQEKSWNIPEAEVKVKKADSSSQLCVKSARSKIHGTKFRFHPKCLEKPEEGFG